MLGPEASDAELLAARPANGYDVAGVARNAGHPDAAA